MTASSSRARRSAAEHPPTVLQGPRIDNDRRYQPHTGVHTRVSTTSTNSQPNAPELAALCRRTSRSILIWTCAMAAVSIVLQVLVGG